MKKTDLRIGNLVMATDLACNEKENTILEVSGVGLDVSFTNGTTQNYIGVKGIGITKEKLLEIGFEECLYGDMELFFKNMDVNVLEKNSNSRVYIKVNGFRIPNHCKYIHELQNLFFALTSEELKL